MMSQPIGSFIGAEGHKERRKAYLRPDMLSKPIDQTNLNMVMLNDFIAKVKTLLKISYGDGALCHLPFV